MSPPPGKKAEATASSVGRKRRGSESGGGSVGAKICAEKTTKTDVQKVDVMALEEIQSTKRTPESDSELYASNCANLREILDEILKAKLSAKKGLDAAAKAKIQSEVNELRVRFGLAFVNLKKLNRLDKLRTKKIREDTSGVMQRVDQFHLQLQNLRYEVMHLEKEVTKCLQFRSADQDINLVSEEEFRNQAPEEIKQKVDDAEGDKDHNMRLARLEYERLQRREMHESLQKLNGEKRAFHRTIGDKKAGLAGLKPQLAAILERTKSVQEYLDMPLDEERDQLAMARHLPPPLFVLFSEMRAYGHACDSKLAVEIVGDLDEAKTYNAAQRNANSAATVNQDEEDEGGASTGGGGSGRKKKHEDDEEETKESLTDETNNKSGKDKKDGEAARKRLLVSHPLKVKVTMNGLAAAGSLELAFEYLTQIKIVTVKVGVNLESSAPEGLLSPDSLLSHLMFDDDDGKVSPNPTTFYLMRRMSGTEALPKTAKVGSAYRWAQVLAGLQFPDEMPPEDSDAACQPFKADKAVCQIRIEAVVKAIRQRLMARLALQKQVSVLEAAKNSQVDLPIPTEFSSLENDLGPGSAVRSKIRAWYGIDYEQYISLDITSHLVGECAVRKNDFFYRLQVNREPATLIALVSISPDYPTTPPAFCLNLHWNGTSWTVHNSEKVRALEREINTFYQGLVLGEKGVKAARYVISLQIRRLMVLFDVLLESWNQVQVNSDPGTKVDFPREKIFLQPVRGRTRAPPLRHDKQLQIFTQ